MTIANRSWWILAAAAAAVGTGAWMLRDRAPSNAGPTPTAGADTPRAEVPVRVAEPAVAASA